MHGCGIKQGGIYLWEGSGEEVGVLQHQVKRIVLLMFWTGSRSIYPLFYARSHLRAPKNGHTIISAVFWNIFIFEYSSTQFTLWIMYWGNHKNVCYSCVSKRVPILCLFFLPPRVHLPFLHLKIAHEYWGNIYVHPQIKRGRIKKSDIYQNLQQIFLNSKFRNFQQISLLLKQGQ